MLQNATRGLLHFLGLLIWLAGSAGAASLSVTPTNVDVAPQRAQTTMTVKSAGRGPSVVQLRIYRWKEGQPASRLKPTRDVAISPPMVRLQGNQELTVRIVRTSGRKLRGRECYRVLVDRLPDPSRGIGQIGLRIRHSVPVCFNS